MCATYVCDIYKIFMYLSISGHLGCFHILIVMNNSGAKIGADIALRYSVFSSFGYISDMELLDHMLHVFLILRNSRFFIWFISNRVQEFPFLHIFTKINFEIVQAAPADYGVLSVFWATRESPYNPHERTISYPRCCIFQFLGEGWHNK